MSLEQVIKMCGWRLGREIFFLFLFFFHFSSDFLFHGLNWNCLKFGKLLRDKRQQDRDCGKLWGAGTTQALPEKAGPGWAPTEEEASNPDPGIPGLWSQQPF